MPRLNARGDVAMGVGDGRVVIKRSGQAEMVLLPNLVAGGVRWLNDDEVVFQARLPEGYRITAAHATTGALRPEPLHPTGANVLEANGAGWASWLRPSEGVWWHPGADATSATLIAQAGLRAMGRDGTLAYCRLYVDGTGLLLRHPDGREAIVAESPVVASHVCVQSFDVAAWVDGAGRVRTRGLPPAVTTDERAYSGRLAILPDGEAWLLYHVVTLINGREVNRLLLQPLGEPVGYVVALLGENTFGPDVCALPNGRLRICWSVGAGERFGELRLRDINPQTESRVALTYHDPPAPPPVRPRVTISEYAPTSGVAPLSVRATAVLSGGPATSLSWRSRSPAGPWARTSAPVPASGTAMKTFTFAGPGTYEIGVDVTGPGGSDGTSQPRIVTVESAPPPPPPTDSDVTNPPALLPSRGAFLLGVCWPTPGVTEAIADVDRQLLLALKVSTGATSLRFNLTLGRPDPVTDLLHVAGCGFRPLPLLDFDDRVQGSDVGWTPDRIAAWCFDIARRCPWVTDYEVLNEAGRLTVIRAAEIAAACIRGLQQGNPNVRAWLGGGFGELYSPEHGAGAHTPAMLRALEEAGLNPAGVTWHPYRDPHGSDWAPSTPQLTRQAEWDAVRALVGGRPVLVSEVGWEIAKSGGQQKVAGHLGRELRVLRALDAAGAFIYAHVSKATDGYGVMNEDWTPRPAALVMAQFAAELS